MMNFTRFLSMPTETFASRFQRDGHMLMFHHIPKTAGSSLTRELSLTLPPYQNIHVGPDGHGVDRTKSDPLAQAVDAFLTEEPTRRFRSASGHLRPKHLQTVREQLPYVSVFTVLRDPVARVISDYRYSSTPKHPPHKEFIAKFPTIEAYLDSEQHQNKMWRLVGGRDMSEDSLKRLYNRYLFFGLVEDLTLHFEFLTSLLGCPKTIATRANVTQASDSNKVDLTPELRSRIEQANSDDVAFYEAIRTALEGKRDDMAAYVEQRRAEYVGALSA